eukprot:RCo047760
MLGFSECQECHAVIAADEEAFFDDKILVSPVYTVSYSSSSGSIFEALCMTLLSSPHWTLGRAPERLRSLALHDQIGRVDLVLGDRYDMDESIRRWRIFIRSGYRPSVRHLAGKGAKHRVLVNYYAGSKELTLKSNMVRHLRRALRHPHDIIPPTYILKPKCRTDERSKFLEKYFAIDSSCLNVWIVKPSRMNKAVGIRVMDRPEEILWYIDRNEERGEWVVQKYIERPFLLGLRKFDIRSWVVVDPKFNIWLWSEGVLRTCSEPFSLEDLNNDLIHLSNHCVQEKGPNFAVYECGNEMWYSQFQDYLDFLHPGLNFREQVIPTMKEIIKTCFDAVKTHLLQSVSGEFADLLCYQVFGFDFMLDENFTVFLIEINGQPAVAEALLPAFTQDCIDLLIRPMFPVPPTTSGTARSRFDLVSSGEKPLRDPCKTPRNGNRVSRGQPSGRSPSSSRRQRSWPTSLPPGFF